MSASQHSAPDTSFVRSATTGLARGAVLIVAAVVVGVLLLRSTDGAEPFRSTSANTPEASARPTTATTARPGGATTTTVAAKAHDPAQVTVLVANGTSQKGAAGKIGTALKGANYVTSPPANTAAPAGASVVYFTAGYEADAKAVAGLLTPAPATAAMPNPPPVADLGGAKVLVVIGPDLAT